MPAAPGEKRNIAILVISQTLFMVAAITVLTVSGVTGQQLTSVPGLATLPPAMMAGALLHLVGWNTLNLVMLPLILVVAVATLVMRFRTAQQPVAQPARAVGNRDD